MRNIARMNKQNQGFRWYEWALWASLTLLVGLICVGAGSVAVPLPETARVLWAALLGQPIPQGVSSSILLSVRLPRVCCVALSGGALSLCGAAMQGLFKNPLADGSTMGVSAGASLGAALAIALGFTLPGVPMAGTVGMAMAFACGTLLLILALSYAVDRSLSTHTMILLGVVFTMFFSSVISILMVFAGEKLRSIVFWTLGSLAGAGEDSGWMLLYALVVCGGVLLCHGRELNAFALGEEEAAHMGVAVKRVKLTLLIAVSALIGVCVSIGGNIGFVGLITPHLMRKCVGANHRRLLPASLFAGALFLMLADLLARTVFSPLELPIGAVTSVVGAVVFVAVFYKGKKAEAC